MKGRFAWKKSAVFAALCMALLCASVHGEGATQEQKKIPSGVEGMIEKFLQRGKYIKLPLEVEAEYECFMYLWATNIQGVAIAGNTGISIIYSFDDTMEFGFSEYSISLDSECNLIIKPKK